MFRENFDIPGLGRFVLGRFTRTLTPFEQQQFLALFETYVVYTYGNRLSDFAVDGSVPQVTGSRLGADGVIVSSEVFRGRRLQPIKVDWRLSWRDSVYKISDIFIDGRKLLIALWRYTTAGVSSRGP